MAWRRAGEGWWGSKDTHMRWEGGGGVAADTVYRHNQHEEIKITYKTFQKSEP